MPGFVNGVRYVMPGDTYNPPVDSQLHAQSDAQQALDAASIAAEGAVVDALAQVEPRLSDLESRSGTSVSNNVATFTDLPTGPNDGQSWIVRSRPGHPVPHPALYTWSETTGEWSEPVSMTGSATAAAIAAALPSTTVRDALPPVVNPVIDARTGTGKRPIGRDELLVLDTNHASLEAALAAVAGGGTLEVRGQHSRAATFTVDKACTIRFAQGGQITTTSASTTAINVTADDVTLDRPRLIGTGHTVSGTGRGIGAVGTAAAPVRGLTIRHPHLSGFNQFGIYTKNIVDFTIEQVDIHDIGYAGVYLLSSIRGKVSGGTIRNIVQAPGYPQSYGVTVNRDNTVSISEGPRSAHVTVENLTVDGVPNWKGLDTHAGEDVRFIGNTVLNCSRGIYAVAGKDTTGADAYAPLGVIVANNYLDSGKDDGIVASGVAIVGAGTAVAPVERATGSIYGNTVRRYGTAAESNAGGILTYITDGVSVAGNTIFRPGHSGVCGWHTNAAMSVMGNTIIDAWSPSAAAQPAGVVFPGGGNTVAVGGNALMRGGKDAPRVNWRGLYAQGADSAVSDLGNDWSGITSTIAVNDPMGVVAARHQSSRLGFFSAAPVTRPTATADAASLRAALVALGLIAP